MPPQTTNKKAREGRRARGGGAASGSSARATAAAAAAGSTQQSTGRKAGVGQGRRGPFVYRNEFRRDVEGLMYAFGDSEHPDAGSVALMEDMTVSFLIDLCRRARPAPGQLAIPSNQAHVQTIAQAATQQQQLEYQQQLVDEAAARAAAGTSSSAKAKAQKQAAAAASAEQQRQQSAMPIRAVVHPFVGRTRMTVEDIKFACRKDAKMTSRIEELIYLDKEISNARRVFDVPAEDAIQDNSAGQASAQDTTNANAA